MPSSYTDLGIELMATGENSGTWGDKTNTNLNIINQAAAGYQAISIAGGVQHNSFRHYRMVVLI
jgi:hypothetical protein